MSDMSQRNAMPPAADHERHDALLVAELAAGDALEPEQLDEARQLVRSCGACAALAADLRVVAAAVAQEPVPPRRRDFRLSPEQAEELSGNVLTRFLRRLSLPSARAFQPAAAGVLSIGLLFVVAGYAWPDGGTITVQADPNFAVYGTAAPAPDGEAVPSPVMLEEGLDDLAASAELEMVDEVAADGVDEEFFETLPESQAGDLDRMSQKSMASEAEAPEVAEEAAVAAGDAATRAADAVAPEAPAALPAEESVATSERLDTAAANDAAAEEPSAPSSTRRPILSERAPSPPTPCRRRPMRAGSRTSWSCSECCSCSPAAGC